MTLQLSSNPNWTIRLKQGGNDLDNPEASSSNRDRWVYFVFVRRNCPDPEYNDDWEIHELTQWPMIVQKCSMHSAESYQKTLIRGAESSNVLILDQQGCFNCHLPSVHEHEFNSPSIGGGMDIEDLLNKDISDIVSQGTSLSSNDSNPIQYVAGLPTALNGVNMDFLSLGGPVFGGE